MTGFSRSLRFGLRLALLGGGLGAQARPSVTQPTTRLELLALEEEANPPPEPAS